MEVISKQEKSKSHQEFQKLLAEDLGKRKFKEGELALGTVSKITKRFVYVELNLKSEAAIPISEFTLLKELDKIKINTQITVLLEKIENVSGDVIASRERAKKVISWKKMEKNFEAKKSVTGTILSRVKGGYVVNCDSCLCFLPGSQVDIRPLKNYDHLMNKPQVFEICKIDKRRSNIVLSRRAILEKIRDHDRDKIVSKLSEGDVVVGTVKNLTDFGAFIDLDGVDALLHITDISWSRISHPGDLLNISQSLKLKIIKIDSDTKKVSCGLKQLVEDPYLKKIDKYEVGKNYPAIVTKVTEYGCFASLEDGLEGLIHSSELSFTKTKIHPGKVLTTTQRIQVQILEKDSIKRRLSLSYKKTQINPWSKFNQDFKEGDEIKGTIKNITDFAIFVLIKDSGLDGMCHKNDISHSPKDSDLEKFKKNQLLTLKILEINESKEKIRLGLKQLTPDYFTLFFQEKKVGDVITATVSSSNYNGIYVNAGNKESSILIKKSQLAIEPENQRPSRWTKGDRVDAKIISLNKDKHEVQLSIKSLLEDEQKLLIKRYGSKDSGRTLSSIFPDLGSLLKKKAKTKKE